LAIRPASQDISIILLNAKDESMLRADMAVLAAEVVEK
jgi:hypothetical protein